MKGDDTPGIEYAPGIVGQGTFRVRERCVADHLAPLISTGRADAAKLYVVLRGIALLEVHAGAREVGTVLPAIRYEQLHDMCRDPRSYSIDAPPDYIPDARDLKAKRRWVSRQLERLERRRLLGRRLERPGRPGLVLLRDDGSEEPLDDPTGGTDSSYVTLFGSVVSSVEFRSWGGPELMAYMCAMVAGRYATNKKVAGATDPATATWFQTARWFTTKETLRPEGHVLFPVGVRTVQRGLESLEQQGWLASEWRKVRPDTGARFRRPRKVYENNFARYEQVAEVVDLAEEGRRRRGA